MGATSAEETKAFGLMAFDTLFDKRDYAKAAQFWSEGYIQHSSHISPGRSGLFDLVRAAPPSFRYENHCIAGDGDMVLLQPPRSEKRTPDGRYTIEVARGRKNS